MFRGGEKFPINPAFFGVILLILSIGWFICGKISSNVAHASSQSLASQPDYVRMALIERLSTTQDVNELLHLGLGLLNNNQPSLAELVLSRARTIYPESRDVNYLLAWNYIALAQEDQETENLEEARFLLQKTTALDPLYPGITELRTVLRQMELRDGEL